MTDSGLPTTTTPHMHYVGHTTYRVCRTMHRVGHTAHFVRCTVHCVGHTEYDKKYFVNIKIWKIPDFFFEPFPYCQAFSLIKLKSLPYNQRAHPPSHP